MTVNEARAQVQSIVAKVPGNSPKAWMLVTAQLDNSKKLVSLKHGYIPREFRHPDEDPGVEETPEYAAFYAWEGRLDAAEREIQKLLPHWTVRTSA